MPVAWSNRPVTSSPIFTKRLRKLRNSESALGVPATAQACRRTTSASESKPASSEGMSSIGPPVEKESSALSEAGSGARLWAQSLGMLATRCPLSHVRRARESRRADARVEVYSTTYPGRLPNGSRLSCGRPAGWRKDPERQSRSEEHTSELQSRPHLVCRLLLEKKKK